MLLAQQAAGAAHHLDARGKQVMGFDQQKTGAIQRSAVTRRRRD
jgi:hypothetical protein